MFKLVLRHFVYLLLLLSLAIHKILLIEGIAPALSFVETNSISLNSNKLYTNEPIKTKTDSKTTEVLKEAIAHSSKLKEQQASEHHVSKLQDKQEESKLNSLNIAELKEREHKVRKELEQSRHRLLTLKQNDKHEYELAKLRNRKEKKKTQEKLNVLNDEESYLEEQDESVTNAEKRNEALKLKVQDNSENKIENALKKANSHISKIIEN